MLFNFPELVNTEPQYFFPVLKSCICFVLYWLPLLVGLFRNTGAT